MLAGGAEAVITPVAVGAFAQMKALSTRNDEPAAASRPYDADRDGFVIGEGAVVFMLEEMEHGAAPGRPDLCRARWATGRRRTPTTFRRWRQRPRARAARCSSPWPTAGIERRAGGLRLGSRDLDARGRRRGGGRDRGGLRGWQDTPERERGQVDDRPPPRSGRAPWARWPRSSRSRRASIPPTINLDNLDPACAAPGP